jgi:hypothetical protein
MKEKGMYITPNLAIGGRSVAEQKPPFYDDPLLAEVYSPAAIALVKPNPNAQRGNNANAGGQGGQGRGGNAPAPAAAGGGRAAQVPAATSYDYQCNSLRKLNRAGVTIALGDDTGIQNSFPGYAALQQMERMGACGMTPQQVLVAVTRTSAQVLRINDMGSMAEGKQASFIVLDANPLDALANARKISKVYLRGQEINREALRAEFRKSWGAGTPSR